MHLWANFLPLNNTDFKFKSSLETFLTSFWVEDIDFEQEERISAVEN